LFYSIIIYIFAQLEVKEGSFKKVEGFVNLNPNIQSDDNDVLYAVVKIRTENINDKQLHELLFEGNLAKQIEPEYGSGFGVRQLERARAFYRIYPIASAVRTQLNWSQYKLLISITDPDKREYYELESINNAWTARETERQINSLLYERLLMSNDKDA